MVAVHPQPLCLCLTVRVSLSSLFQTAKVARERRSMLISPASGMLTFSQMSACCLMLLPPPTHQNSPVTQVDLKTATDPTAMTASTAETADIAAAAGVPRTAHTIAAQATALQTPQSMSAIGMPLVMRPGLFLDRTTQALTDR